MTVGQSAPRSDADAKVRGEATFGVDLTAPGMLYGHVLRSTVAAGLITRLDTSAAMEIDGVHDIVTAAEAPLHRAGVILHDIPFLAAGYVAYEGEPIAVVVADSPEIAAAAARAIDVEIEPQQPVATPEQALEPDARLVHPTSADFITGGAQWTRYGNVVAEITNDPNSIDQATLDAAFADADVVVEQTYSAPRQYQAYLEPKMALATYEAGRYTLQVSHQYPFRLRDRAAHMLGVAPSAIRVVGHHIGGGFGAKLDVGLEAFAALLARRTRRPVKLVNTAQEELLTAPCRANAAITVRSAVKRDGTVLAHDVDVVFDSGAYANNGPALSSVPMFVFGSIYRAEKTRVRTRCVYTNTAPTGAFRGVNGPYLVFALERQMDHIANELGVDRRQYRLDSLASEGDKMLNGQLLVDPSVLHEAFDLLEQHAPWDEQATARPEPDKVRGVGVAGAVWLTNPAPANAVLKLNEDGTVGVVTAATDSGSGAVATGIRQIAAEGLGVPVARVVVTMPDTDSAGYDAGSQGSRTTHVVGRAVFDAATEVKQQVLDRAATMLEAAVEDLVVEDGGVHVAGVPSSGLTLAQVAMAATFSSGPIAATSSYATPAPDYDPGCASGMLFANWPTHTYHAHLAEVEVDTLTGQVEVTRYVVVQEVGRAINPQSVMGQIQGGVTQGLGYALWERLDIDEGRYAQRSFETLGLPLAVDVPRVEAVLMEHPNPAGPYGALGVAEPPIVPVAAAVANAVADAIGAPIDSLPITAEDVLDALDR
ncbi:MAG: xanthine dehydrogenase family protein molybdopterin-binding subunit [Actinomycetota bacterium]|nr:xanthine dehydrogenase family protein molybdopterin-binding subunit [Actinomycetota bacterium]